jgi:UDP-2,3-diacylglucosamine hydrolase
LADLLLSDVHLRLDRPERGQRLERLVESLEPADRLIVVGDLCDFWFASRQRRSDWRACPGLRSLRAFRDRGGALVLMLGNHDAWLGSYYSDVLGVCVTPEPFDLISHGLRLRLAHGHRVRAKSRWKGWMESRAFLRAFEAAPAFLARRLAGLLEASNEHTRARTELRMIDEFERHARALAEPVDLLVFGHVHRVHLDDSRRPALVVLGDWTEGTRYLRIDESGAAHHAADGRDDGQAGPEAVRRLKLETVAESHE